MAQMVKNLPAMQKTWLSVVLCDDLEGWDRGGGSRRRGFMNTYN